MIRLPKVRQKPGLCGPAALKILLSYYGKRLPLRKLVHLCKTDPKIGTYHADMARLCRKLGFKTIAKDRGTLQIVRNYLENKTPVLVGWFAFSGDHFSVISNVTKKYVYMRDTERKLKYGKRKIPIQRFMELWFDFDDKRDPNKKTNRWYMVINPKQKSKP
ncbi:C39 family peptidase [Candidatus Jorgensenbacteria bacterium]|nr:C39 family peptidase [Candidatus Jorgensenbacteria bacterium]